MNQEQAIQLIQEKIDEVDINKFTAGNNSSIFLEEWQDSTLKILKKVFGKKADEVLEFDLGKYTSVNESVLEEYEILSDRSQSVERLKLKLQRYIKHINQLGLESTIDNFIVESKKSNNTGVVIYNNNNVNISIIIQNIFEGLDDTEKEALKKILEQYDKDRNRDNLIQSLQSIGKGVVENIVANLITNPALIGQIINTL